MNPVERNLRLYPLLRMAANGYAWIPVFFLYLSQTQPLERVIQLSAIFYLAVFILEVPSGYFSDRFGRRITLLIAACALALSYTCFLIGGNFWWFAAGQVLLAAGIAIQSGTDSALLYDSLSDLERTGEYQQREARAEQFGLVMMAVACLAGGLLGLIDLRLAYGYSLISALVMMAIAWQIREPGHHAGTARGFTATLGSCLCRLRDPVLLWLLLLAIALYSLAHIVFELYQPYIILLQFPLLTASDYAPLISGIVIAVSMFGGAIGARLSTPWLAHLGLVWLLALATLLQLGIVGAMALSISPLVLVLICGRNFPMSLVLAPVRAAIAPRISREQRATYLSLQSLAEHLVFAALLFWLSLGLARGTPVSEPQLLAVMRETLWLGLLFCVPLFAAGIQIGKLLQQDLSNR